MRLRDIAIPGTKIEIGSYEFTAERIIEFATKFDPQIFHTDAEAAKDSMFGGLCASGWHICAAAMKCNVAFILKEFSRIARAGGIPPKLGPSPGFKDLKWLKPVYAGDTITFFLQFTGDEPIAHRPGRHFVSHIFEGVNQKGELVLSFDSRVVEFE